jgi:FAD/FMN-containing dehydrogenase
VKIRRMHDPIDPVRRRLLRLGATLPVTAAAAPALRSGASPADRVSRVRPGDAGWPTDDAWRQFGARLSPDALVKVRSPWPACVAAPQGADCARLFAQAKNPYFLGDDVALTQTLGWVDAWTSSPSVYAVAAESTADMVAAVNFARERRLRLVVKGGGHSYQGTSNAPDSLLVWTRRMNRITVHDAFVPQGCTGRAVPVRAVSVGAGAMWSQAYDAVTTRGGGYVQGGGCMTVGVAGLVQSGGFGSFSKAFGLAAGGLLEAEVVTADGSARVVNACSHPDLFWGLKGGGGASLGVVTRLTLRVHELPERFGAVNFTVRATSPDAFRRLVALAIDFYARALMNPHWGEQIRFRPGNIMSVAMVFQGLDRGQAVDVWQPFLDALARAPQDFSIDEDRVDLGAHLLVAHAREEGARFHPQRRPARRAGNQRVLARRRGSGRPVPAWLPVGVAVGGTAAGRPPCGLVRRIGGRGAPPAAVAAFQQGPGRRVRRRDRGGTRHGNESCRARCVRAGDLRRGRAAGLSRRRRA